MEKVKVVILKDCRGSENGLVVKTFIASEVVQDVEKGLAEVFVKSKLAKYAGKEEAKVEPKKKEEVKKFKGAIDNKMVSPKEDK